MKTIKSKKLKKEFRIYKWEDKPFKDFKMPNEFSFAEHSDFIYLYDNNLIELERFPVAYFIKNWSERNIKNGWELSRVYLDGNGILGSYNDGLEDSIVAGRVVVSKEIKK